jgi:hypothetical protein
LKFARTAFISADPLSSLLCGSKAFTAIIGERAAAAMAEEECDAELGALTVDPAAAPVVAPILSRCLVLKNAFNPKRLVKNPYLDGPDVNGDAAAPTAFPDVEKFYLSLCCQFGYVRYVAASVQPPEGLCVVKVGFATKDGAQLCVDALHGRPTAWQVATPCLSQRSYSVQNPAY